MCYIISSAKGQSRMSPSPCAHKPILFKAFITLKINLIYKHTEKFCFN